MSNKIFGNDIKYADYLESVELDIYEAEFVEAGITEEKISEMFERYPVLVPEEKLKELKIRLIEVKPF
ncbi:hypothetical protein HC176_15985 [Tamlana crocina]|uniref:Uncharacterized protein n=1 Tax=Tamlana crocina TaxID=393006 RepID=A0ABX1DF71_9FLAO|nr:hypothetical protein [Tamlana crocina]